MNKRISATLKAFNRNELFIMTPYLQQERAASVAKSKASSAYCMKRRKIDPAFRMIALQRSRIRAAVLSQAALKSGRSLALLGCTAAELRDHIASQFQPGMTWENFGKWEIDHVKPCRAFDLNCKAQQSECFHFSNLQPLWRRHNRMKSDRWLGERARTTNHGIAIHRRD